MRLILKVVRLSLKVNWSDCRRTLNIHNRNVEFKKKAVSLFSNNCQRVLFISFDFDHRIHSLIERFLR